MSFELFLGWIIFSFIVGAIGDSRKIGFWGAFLASIILSPLIGLIITLVSKNKKEEEYKNNILKAQKKQQDALNRIAESKPIVKNDISIIEELEKLKKLKDDGIVTEDEFLSLKKKIIDSNINITSSVEEKPVKKYAFSKKLINGVRLQYLNEIDSINNPEVRINDAFPINGYYKLYNKKVAYKITDGEITNTYYTTDYKQNNGDIIEVGTFPKGFNGISKGNPVWLNDKPAPDGRYKIALLDRINVVNGIIVNGFGIVGR